MVSPFGWLLGLRARLHSDEAGGDELMVLIDASLDSRLVVYHEPRSYQAEQYRAFRTNLRAMNRGDSPKTLMFTSPALDEGKSVTVANVALCLAEFSELRVCLVDMDLRAPRLHDLFGVARGPGLADVLLDRADPRQALRPVAMPNFALLPAGRTTDKPNEVLGSEYVLDLVRYLKQDFNYIVIDTPPSTLFADASHVARMMDGLVMVVSLRDTPRHQADEALEALRAAGANVMGTFVTGTATAQADDASAVYRG